jgi:hypothetical protein
MLRDWESTERFIDNDGRVSVRVVYHKTFTFLAGEKDAEAWLATPEGVDKMWRHKWRLARRAWDRAARAMEKAKLAECQADIPKIDLQ